MDPKYARPSEYGSLQLIVGRRYRVTQEFRDHHGSMYLPGEEFTYRGFSYFPYDDGHTLYLTTGEGKETSIAFCGLDPDQNRLIEALHEYMSPI